MRTMRNRRGKSARTPTVWEIKRAICVHEQLEPVGPPEHRSAWGDWRTKVNCPTCGYWNLAETPDTARLSPAVEVGAYAAVPVGVSCMIRQPIRL